MSIFERCGRWNLVCTWHMCARGLTSGREQVKFRLATRVVPGTLVLEVLLTIFFCFPHLSPPTDAAGELVGKPGLLCRLHAQQFDRLCFLFCPSLKGKDVPTLLQDCTSLCPDNHETAWETDALTLSPTPAREKMLHRAGFVQEPGRSKAWREFPFSGAAGCQDFEDLYQKCPKRCYQKVG